METGVIERELYIEAVPEVVFEVVSNPEHVKRWWPDNAQYEVVAGSTGEISFGDCAAGGKVMALTVVEARPPHMFSFRWTHPTGTSAVEGNSLLVTFTLSPSGDGTLLHFTETGFRELAGQPAVAQEMYQEHVQGWDLFLPRLAPYVASLQLK
ncbi:SRPBCC family protein [Actinoplanes sp. TFC3]|uniref:SRPBCC family protein n=1 Tax=Actinoplanes sp. TFC3 TaxID=1710355 RepID=UPI00082B2481|nr:SRPBCC family protein [Actinoplanes sp. TFC3]